KSRLVPLHASTCKVLTDYARHRDRRFGRRPDGPFLVIRTATGWTRARSIGPSTACPGRSDCALWVRAGAHAWTISGTGLRSRLCFGGIATETIRHADCPSCLPVWDTRIVTDMYWYLTGTPELLGAAARKLEKRSEGLYAG